MKNKELAKIFYAIADYLKMEGVAFKPTAYKRAALAIENLEEDIEKIYKKGGLKELEKIPGVGKSIALKIVEYLKTGKIERYEKFKKKAPIDLEEIVSIEGMGPKKAKVLYQKLGIKNLKDLERAAKRHQIAPLFGFGEKTEKSILEGIEFLKKSKKRFLLGYIMPIAENILERLKNLREVKQVSLAGSIRRMKETIGDIDILAVSANPQKVMDFFVSQPEVVKVWGKGLTKSSVRVKDGFDIDLRIVAEKSYGSALQYFTGSKEHNIAVRRIAIEKGLKLNEYGLFRGKKMIAGKTEEEIYQTIGLPLIPPEMRTNRGEIEAALNGKLPKIIGYNDIKGDIHCHIKWRKRWDGGTNTIEEMARAAMQMGYQYIGIASHTKFLKIEHGLDEKQLDLRNKDIERINSELQILNPEFQILKGCEANILNNGSVDINDEALKKLDYVIAGVHSNLKMSRDKMTERIIKAMKNPNVDIISHPTGRIIQRRDECQIDFGKILRAAKEFKVILEINSFPDRLDLKDVYIKLAKEAGVKMVINSDSHHKDHLRFVKYGIAQARRGWAGRKDIINTYSVKEMLQFLKRNS